MTRIALSEDQIASALAELDGWSVDQGALVRRFAFGDFKKAFAFMTAVAFEAEALNHHPDWTNVYNRIDIRLSTHDAGAITALDLELARRMSELHARPQTGTR